MKTKMFKMTWPALILGLSIVFGSCSQSSENSLTSKTNSVSSGTDSLHLVRRFYSEKIMKSFNEESLKQNLQSLPVIKGVIRIDSLSQIDRSPNVVSSSEGERVIESANDSIHLNGKKIKLQAAELDALELIKLKDVAWSLDRCTGTCQDTMLALRVIYGQQSDSLFFYYQPLLLCANGPTLALPSSYVGKEFTLCDEGLFYYYESSQFKPVRTSTEVALMNARIALYGAAPTTTSAYGVEMYYNGQWMPFKATNDSDPTASVKSMVFPIDQLIQLSQLVRQDGKVKFWNYIGITQYQSVRYPKHELLLSDENAIYSGGDMTPGKEFSDMSHICPPRCSVFTFYILP